MNVKTLIALAALAAAGPSIAGDYQPFPIQDSGTTNRTEVRAQARAAVTADEIQVGEVPLVQTGAPTLASRTAVRAEAAHANARDLLPNGELLSFERRALRSRAG